ncbi:MAG: methyltransferase domain-containing protein [Comamonadaceae bacterium]|nr:MAG: methyltransferase domain-containing protein [Comamonadaceae bacterium]
MDARLQRRIQRYGWDLAAPRYEALWQAQFAEVQACLLAAAALAPGDQVLDVACGTGYTALEAARAVGARGRVLGVDLSGAMVDVARQRAGVLALPCVAFERMDAEQLALPDAGFDAVLCALGLMYMPDPVCALREMRRMLRPGGRLVLAVWGERARCGWATLFELVDAEVASEVCPYFFGLGQPGALARACTDAQLHAVSQRRIDTALVYSSADDACEAAFAGGPVALAWSRFDEAVRARVRTGYVASLAPWRHGAGYRVPGEFVVVAAQVPG